jgi:hypothetical protein
VTFSGNNYGQLQLADAPDFAGTVAGFAGTAAGYGTSDSILLEDINFSSAQFNLAYAPNTGGTGGVLTVADGTNTANIKFAGSYVQSNFVAQNNGNGTIIYDPPVSNSLLVQGMASMGGAGLSSSPVTPASEAKSDNFLAAGGQVH